MSYIYFFSSNKNIEETTKEKEQASEEKNVQDYNMHVESDNEGTKSINLLEEICIWYLYILMINQKEKYRDL